MTAASHITLRVTVRWGERSDVYTGLELDDAHPRSIHNVLQAVDPTDEFSLVWLDVATGRHRCPPPDALLAACCRLVPPDILTGGTEQPLTPGRDHGRGGRPRRRHRGGHRARSRWPRTRTSPSWPRPNAVRFDTETERKTATDDLIAHCEALKAYRIGIVDPPPDSSISEVREFRSQFDTKYAALYYPWVRDRRPDGPGRPDAPARPCSSCRQRLRGRHLRPQRHRARRAQGAGQRGGARHHQVHAPT